MFVTLFASLSSRASFSDWGSGAYVFASLIIRGSVSAELWRMRRSELEAEGEGPVGVCVKMEVLKGEGWKGVNWML